MGRIGLAIVVACAVVVALLAATVHAEDRDDGIRWETDLSAARIEAAERGRPLLVVFR